MTTENSTASDSRAVARNPIVGLGAIDTVHNAACALEYLSQVSLKDSCAPDDELEYGKFLCEQTIVLALQTAKEQMEREFREALPATAEGAA